MAGLDFLFSPNSQFYNARQTMINDNLNNVQKDLANQTTEAALPGVVGLSQSRAAQGQLDEATLQDKIREASAKHLQAMDEMQLKELNGFGEKFSQVGAYLENIPAPLRGAEYERMRAQYKLPPIPGLEQLGPDQLPAALSKTGQSMVLLSADSIKKRELERMQQEGALARTVQQGKDQVTAAGVKADATLEKTAMDNQAKMERLTQELSVKVQLAERKAQLTEASLNIEKQLRALVMEKDFDTNPEKQQKYRQLVLTQNALDAQKANQTNPEILAGRAPSIPVERGGQIASEVAPLPPPDAQKPSAEPANDTLAYYKKLYAGKGFTDEQIRAAYKKKTGKDLK